MIQSMTGYATTAAESSRGRLNLEMRTVNSRFLDLQFRIAEELRPMEPMLREMVTGRIGRGKVDLRLYYAAGNPPAVRQSLNIEVLHELQRLDGEVRKVFPDAGSLRTADVLRWPGILAEGPVDEEQLRSCVEQLCHEALDELVASRAREGARLTTVILDRIAQMRKQLDDAAPHVPKALADYQEKVAQRLRDAIGTANDERIRAEIAIFGIKVDIDEELTRLVAHLDETERALGKGGAVGKRLDFLAQELNREANTLASKAPAQQLSECALELKLLVEQIREQVQNLE